MLIYQTYNDIKFKRYSFPRRLRSRRTKWFDDMAASSPYAIREPNTAIRRDSNCCDTLRKYQHSTASAYLNSKEKQWQLAWIRFSVWLLDRQKVSRELYDRQIDIYHLENWRHLMRKFASLKIYQLDEIALRELETFKVDPTYILKSEHMTKQKQYLRRVRTFREKLPPDRGGSLR